MAGLFHISRRKRKSGQLEPFPARRFPLRMLDSIVLFTGIVGPLMTIPQIYDIYALHQVAGVSLITWGTYAFFDLPWVIYGFVHRERTIAITYILWCTMNALVALGVIVFSSGSL